MQVPDGALKEEDLLVGDREVGERVQLQQRRLPLTGLGGSIEKELRIDDRRREEPERQQVRQDVADVAKVHGQRRQHQGEAERQDQLHQDDERKSASSLTFSGRW